MYNLIARSVFALALMSVSAMACQNVAASSECNPQPRVWRGDDGSKWIVSPAGNLMRKPYRFNKENAAQYAALATVTVLDWTSTQRLTRTGRGREGNPLIASNGHASVTRFSLMTGFSLGMWLLHDAYLKPRAMAQGKKESKSVRVIRWALVAGRGASVVNNYAR